MTFGGIRGALFRRATHHGFNRQPRMNPTAKQVEGDPLGTLPRVFADVLDHVFHRMQFALRRHGGPFLTARLLHPLRLSLARRCALLVHILLSTTVRPVISIPFRMRLLSAREFQFSLNESSWMK